MASGDLDRQRSRERLGDDGEATLGQAPVDDTHKICVAEHLVRRVRDHDGGQRGSQLGRERGEQRARPVESRQEKDRQRGVSAHGRQRRAHPGSIRAVGRGRQGVAGLESWRCRQPARSAAWARPPPARRQLECTYRPEDRRLAHEAARLAQGQKSLFFCQTRKTAEGVAAEMQRVGTNVMVHHSAVAREERARVEETFHSASDVCIVCTSTLELGIDVGDLDRVLQAEAPTTVSSFLQRMGRTGRRPGQTANTAFLCAASDSVILAVAVVELARQGWVEAVPCVTRCPRLVT